MGDSNLSEVPLKQRRAQSKPLIEYQQYAATRDEAILNAYRSDGYTHKQIGEIFGIHYSMVSRIAAKNSKP